MERPSIFTYFDFRRFLRDSQQQRRSVRPAFTLEYIAGKVGLKSKGHVSLIFKGAKNIPDEKLPLFAHAFDLDERETEFFGHLVHFGQARTHRDRKKHLDMMVGLMRVADRRLVPRQYALCQEWWHPVIHELLRIGSFQDDWEGIGRRLRPAITAEQARESVALLEEIGLVRKDASGCWKPTEAVITFGEGWSSVAVRQFQIHTFAMARQALEDVPVDERDVSTLTLSVGETTFREIRSRLALVRQEILALARSERSPDRVCQMNLALFPLTSKEVR